MKSFWEINLTGDLYKGLEDVLLNLNEVERAAGVTETSFDQAFGGKTASSLGNTVWGIKQVAGSLNDLFGSLNEGFKPFLQFDQASHELKSMANVSDETLTQIKKFSKESAEAFGGDASANIETYKILLSKLGPELAETPEVLKAMGDNVAILSKSMGGDTAGAVNVLTTAMNQYGVSIENPTQALAQMSDMMNKMQAGALAGSSELPELQLGIAQAGAMANAANVQFAEMNAALQVLDKGSKKGAEGGVALRNAMTRMGEGRFMPQKTMEGLVSAGVNIDVLSNKSLTFADRLKELSKIKSDDALVSQFFGVENVAAGQFMLSNIALLEDFTGKINENKTAAIDSAQEVMSSYQEKLSRMDAFFNNIKISAGEFLAPAIPAIKAVSDLTGGFLNMAPGMVAMIDLYGKMANSQKLMTFLTELQTFATVGLVGISEVLMAVSPWAWIAIAIAAVVVVVMVLWDKFDGLRKFLFQFGYAVKEIFMSMGELIVHALTAPIKLIWGLFTLDLDMMKDALIGHVKIVAKAVEKGVGEGTTAFNLDNLKKTFSQGLNVGVTTTGDTAKSVVPNPNPSSGGAYPEGFTPKGGKKKGVETTGGGSSAGGGGTQHRNVTITINGGLVKEFIVNTTNIGESMTKLKEMVADTLIGAVRDSELALADHG